MSLLERDDALGALAAAHAAASAGSGRVVLVTGEPGIGKTALVNAFLASLEIDSKVLLGTCDDLSIARPLGPFLDLLGRVSAPLEEALAGATPSHGLHRLLLDELDVQARTTVLVIEDVHWADDATLDALTYIARRIEPLRALLVLTMRPGDVIPAVPVAGTTYLELTALSEAAVLQLAGDAAGAVFAATGGNPFLVTELLDAREGEDVPLSVAHAVLGRLTRLDEDARRLVELVAVVPRRVRTSLLDRAFPEWPYAAAAPERQHLLDIRPHYVAFRHELVRAAVVNGIPAATRRRLHADILAALLATGGDPADVVHHAEGAGAEDTLASNALVAARRAGAVESHREAYAHYRRALDFLDRLSSREQALVLEEVAAVAHPVGKFDEAIAAVERAREMWRALGDDVSVGRCTRVLGRLRWFIGDGAGSRAEAREAVAILERADAAAELASAYGLMARVALFAGDFDEARDWAERARELAASLGDDRTRVNAIVTLATVEADIDPRPAPLLEAHQAASAAGIRQEAVVALGNLAHAQLGWGLAREAARYVDRFVAEADEAELHHLVASGRTLGAWLRLRAGDWATAEETASAEARRGASVSELLAQTVLAELAVRRGDAGAAETLHALLARIRRTGDVDGLPPVIDLLVERALLDDGEQPLGLLRELLETRRLRGQFALRLAAASAVAGIDGPATSSAASPYSYVAAREWQAAADAFGTEGWTYDRALMLSLLDDDTALLEALDIARRLGARPLARRVARRLRALGLRVPRGPYGAARENRAGLTARQLEVLRLVAAGRTNAEIADELVVSLRTAEHHVAAMLAKLGVSSRREAADRAAELGLATTTV